MTNFCFWSNFYDTVKIQGTDYSVSYVLTNGQITDVIPHTQSKSLIILASATGDGILTITLPREVIDAKIGDKDSGFMVTDDGLPVTFQESKSDASRTLTIHFSAKTNPEIFMITGTYIVPEFGTAAFLLLIIAIASIVLMSTRTKLRFIPRS